MWFLKVAPCPSRSEGPGGGCIEKEQKVLPSEPEFAAEIERELGIELKLTGKLVDVGLSIITQRHARKPPTDEDIVAYRVGHALCAKETLTD
jgi:hypothetical protein